jgi:glycosyltransferase involved in cell wall biosynthesis
MNIGIDARPLMNPRGGGIRSFLYYTIEEIERIDTKNRYFLYSTGKVFLPFEANRKPNWKIRIGKGISSKSSIIWLQTGFNSLAKEDELDVFWGTRHYLPFLFKGVYFVSTVFDLFYYRTPHATPMHIRFINKVATEMTVKRSDKIIATSRATADDLINILGANPKKIRVMYGGINHKVFKPIDKGQALDYAKKKYGLQKPFILCIDIYNPRKNFEAALRAYSLLSDDVKNEYELVGAGNIARVFKPFDVEKRIKDLGLRDHVRLVGYIDHHEMPLFYSACSLFIFPSLYEGFGLPIVEAMACGSPAITSNISSMPEAAGDAAALVDPYDYEEIERNIRKILTNPTLAEEMVGNGLTHCKKFSWRNFAQEIMNTPD